MFLKKNNPGVTLIELLITIVMVGVVAFVFSTIIGQTFRLWFRSGEQEDVRRNARDTMIKISRELLESVAIVGVPFTGASAITFSYDSDSDGISEKYSYYLSGQNILLSVAGGTPITVATGISSLSLSVNTLASSTYQTEVTIDIWSQKGGQKAEFRTRVIPRMNLK